MISKSQKIRSTGQGDLRTWRRKGLTLLEVLVSLLIFIISLAALGQLISFGTARAQEARWRQQGAFLCQAKIDEISVGAEGLTGQNNAPFANLPQWTWSSVCEPDGTAPGLYHVTVTVHRVRGIGNPLTVTISQLVIDPSIRGTNMDPPPPEPMVEDEPGDSSSSSSSSSSSGSGG